MQCVARSRGPQSVQDDVRNAVPQTDHQEEDALMFRRQSPGRGRDPRAITTMKKTYMDEQSRIAPQKPNRRTPHASFSSGRGFRRQLLSRCSVRVEVRDGEARRLLRCGFSRERLPKTQIWTDRGFGYMGVTGRERGSGESQETENRKQKGR